MAYNLLQLTTDQCISHSRNVRSAEWRQNYSPCRYSIPPLHYCSPAQLHPDPSWWQRHPGVAVPVRWRHGIQWLVAASMPAAWFRCVGECTVSCSFLAMSRCRHVCYLPAYETQCWVVFLHIFTQFLQTHGKLNITSVSHVKCALTLWHLIRTVPRQNIVLSEPFLTWKTKDFPLISLKVFDLKTRPGVARIIKNSNGFAYHGSLLRVFSRWRKATIARGQKARTNYFRSVPKSRLYFSLWNPEHFFLLKIGKGARLT